MSSAFDYSKLRQQVFAYPWPLDPLLSNSGHYFLKNSAGQLPYLYLSHYVSKFSQSWFENLSKDLTALDWGCGIGQFSHLLNQAGLQVISAEVRDYCATDILKSAPIKLDHPFRLPFDDHSFDIVLSVGVLEHVPCEEQSLQEIHRVLRPDGLFFCFNLPYFLSWTQFVARRFGIDYHDRLYGRRQVRGILSRHNFELLDMWQRQIFPKNSSRLPFFRLWEALDQWLVEKTFLYFFATSLEFVARRAK